MPQVLESSSFVAVMPKMKPKMARKLRIPMTKPHCTAVSTPPFDSPNPCPAAIQHPNPSTGSYPKLLYHPTAQLPIRTSGQHLTPASRGQTPPPSDASSIRSNFGVLRNSELRRRLARSMPPELGTVVGFDVARDSRVCKISEGRIAPAEIPTTAVPFHVAAPSDESIRNASEGRSLDDQEQIAIEVISQLSGMGCLSCCAQSESNVLDIWSVLTKRRQTSFWYLLPLIYSL